MVSTTASIILFESRTRHQRTKPRHLRQSPPNPRQIRRREAKEEGNENKKKKKKPNGIDLKLGSHFGPENSDSVRKSYSWIKSVARPDGKEVEKFHAERNVSHKVNAKKGNGRNDGIPLLLVKKKITSVKDKVFKEKKHFDKPVREGFACGACGQWGHMRTNKNCPRYKEDVFGEKKVEDLETAELESLSGKYHNPDVAGQLQLKTPIKKFTSKVTAKVAEVEVPENVDKRRGPTQLAKVKFKCGPSDRTFGESPQNIADAETETKPIGKINKLTFYNTKPEDVQHKMQKSSAVWLPSEAERDQPLKKIIIKPLKGITIVEQVAQDTDTGLDHEPRKMKKIVELSSYEKQKKQEVDWHAEQTIKRTSLYDRRLQEEEEKRKSKDLLADDRTMRVYEERRRRDDHQRFLGLRRYEEPVRNEEKQKPKKKKKPDFQEDYSLECRSSRNDRRIPERAAKRRAVVDMEQGEYAPSTKRRRGGEVVLSNLLESIVDNLMKENQEVTYLFVKPVSKKEAPDYHQIITTPMDLSTIREKARKLEYKNREDFRHDVWQITYNAHRYNAGRNHHIPPLADQLLELCDELLKERDMLLTDAEAGIKM